MAGTENKDREDGIRQLAEDVGGGQGQVSAGTIELKNLEFRRD